MTPTRSGRTSLSADAGVSLELSRLEPMLLAEAKKPWGDPLWIAETKEDGYRQLADISGAAVALRTRGGADSTRWYPELVRALGGLTKTRTVLDGEVVVQDEYGRSDFNRLHARSQRRRWFAGAAL